jgi:ribonuclease D
MFPSVFSVRTEAHKPLPLPSSLGFTAPVIDREAELAPFLPQLQAAPWVALDTEADSLHSYPEKLCLLQLSIPGQDVLVDPLAALPLDPLLQALGTKPLILHGADYDLRLLFRTFRFIPQSVFDTMLAARLLGFQHFSYEALVARLAGVKLEKGPQTADWARRPLTDRMLTYARNDSRYLQPICEALTGELRQKGRLDWHREMCARLVAESTRPNQVDPDEVWRIKGAHTLDPRGLAVLRRLWHWRNDEALRASKPPYFVLSHEVLVAVADAASHGRETEPLLPRHLSPHRRRGLLRAVQEVLACPPSEWPRIRRPTGRRLTVAQRRRSEELRGRRDREAKALGVDPSLIAPRTLLIELGADWEAGQALLMDWQRRLLAG